MDPVQLIDRAVVPPPATINQIWEQFFTAMYPSGGELPPGAKEVLYETFLCGMLTMEKRMRELSFLPDEIGCEAINRLSNELHEALQAHVDNL